MLTACLIIATGLMVSEKKSKAERMSTAAFFKISGRFESFWVAIKPEYTGKRYQHLFRCQFARTIVATLGIKEMTQSTLIQKLCTYTQSNPTRSAVFEFNKLIRSIYALRYMLDPQIVRNSHHSRRLAANRKCDHLL